MVFFFRAVADALMRDHFGQFGNIQDVRVFKDKGFSFIKYVADHTGNMFTPCFVCDKF